MRVAEAACVPDDAAALWGFSRRSNWERLVGWKKDGEKEQT